MHTHDREIKCIWMFNHHAISPEQPGGTRHYDLALELTKRGYEVVIFAAGFSHREQREMKLADGEEWSSEDVNGVRFVWIKTRKYGKNGLRRLQNMVSFGRRSQKLAKRLPTLDPAFSQPDLVIGSSVHLFAVAAAARVAERFNARFFMEVRDIWPQTLVDMKVFSNQHPLVLYLRRLERQLYKKAEHIIITLPSAQEYFATHGIGKDRLLYVPQVLSADIYGKARQQAPVEGPFVAGYFGSLGPADYADVLVKSAQYLDAEKYRLVFIGDGEHKSELIKLASENRWAHVAFLDQVPKNEMPEMLAKVNVGLVSLGEGRLWQKYGISKNKIIDYLAAAKPIVLAGETTNDVASQVRCGISVSSGNPRLVAEAIKKLGALSPEDRREMGERGRAYVVEHHAATHLVDKLETLWKPGRVAERV